MLDRSHVLSSTHQISRWGGGGGGEVEKRCFSSVSVLPIQNSISQLVYHMPFLVMLRTFSLRLYGVGHIVKDHSDSERGKPLPPYGLLFPISSKDYFICTIPQTG